MAKRCDALQQVHCQLAMLTSTVNNLILMLSKSDIDTSMFSLPYLTPPAADGCAHFTGAPEASPSPTDCCNIEEGCEGETHHCEASSAASADFQIECERHVCEPAASNLVADAATQVSRPSIIISSSIAHILGHLDEGARCGIL